MKIVILPGVGFISDEPKDCLLLNEISKKFECEIIWHNWQHMLEIPKTNLPYKEAREWISEVILDFQMVIRHGLEMHLPEGDFYIGHSAGSVLALLQTKPSIIFGSPAILVEEIQSIHPVDCLLNSQPVLNIIHKRDILAYPFPFSHVENYYVETGWWKISNWIPVTAHYSYWNSKKVVKKIIKTIKEWKSKFIE